MSGCPFAAIVKATAPAVAPKVTEIVDDFYPRMFRNNPEAKGFFNPANMYDEPPLQRQALANAVIAYASNIDQLGNLAEAVEVISNKHCGLGVKPEHYGIVHKNLMESIGHVLGDIVTPEIGTGWSDAVLALAKILTEAEANLYKAAESRRGGWSGVKDFKVSNIRRLTADCAEFTFHPVDGSGPIDFTPGQFLTVHLKQEGATPRHYTVTNAPGKDFLQCCPKKVPMGLVSNTLHSMKEGDIVGLSAPFGVFKMKEGDAVLISAGIGATPMKSFIESAPGQVKFILHIDKNENTHPFKEEMLDSGATTHFIYTEKSGRPIAENIVKEQLSPYLKQCNFYLCGPGPFLQDWKAALEEAGAKSVNMDIFGPTLAGPPSQVPKKCPVSGESSGGYDAHPAVSEAKKCPFSK
jgi:nitric oxide dioxygenase